MKDFLRYRIKYTGKRTSVKVTPHQLCHTFATQLVNAGCRITTIQALLGHEQINTTLTCARVHNRMVAEDYYEAMAVVEKRLELHLRPSHSLTRANGQNNSNLNNNAQRLLTLVDRVKAEPLSVSHQALLSEMRYSSETLTKSNTIEPLPPKSVVKVRSTHPLSSTLSSQ
jgi:site-specific recombinase XerC